MRLKSDRVEVNLDPVFLSLTSLPCQMFRFDILAVMAIDTVAVNSLLSVPKRGGLNASILYEVPCQKRNEGY